MMSGEGLQSSDTSYTRQGLDLILVTERDHRIRVDFI